MKVKLLSLPFEFPKEELRKVLTEAILNTDYDYVCLSTKKIVFAPGSDWGKLIKRALPKSTLVGIRLRSIAGTGLTYPAKLPRIDSSLVIFFSKGIREGNALKQFRDFPYHSHFRNWATIEFELVYLVDILFHKATINVFEDEQSLINEYGKAADGSSELLFSNSYGVVTFDPSKSKLEKVACSIEKGSAEFLTEPLFKSLFHMLKKAIQKLMKNHDFKKNYDI